MRRIGDMIGEVLREEGVGELEKVVRLKKAWPEIVGIKKAGKTTPYKIEGNRLYVRADSHAWAQELHFDMEEIKGRIRDILGIEIERIAIKG